MRDLKTFTDRQRFDDEHAVVMSETPVPEYFVDTNILLYAVNTHPSESRKTAIARTLLMTVNWGWSAQVAAEFHGLRKGEVPVRSRESFGHDPPSLINRCFRFWHERCLYPAVIKNIQRFPLSDSLVEDARIKVNFVKGGGHVRPLPRFAQIAIFKPEALTSAYSRFSFGAPAWERFRIGARRGALRAALRVPFFPDVPP